VVLFNHPPTPAPDFLVAAAAPIPATLAPGDSASSKVTITPVGTFGSSVALSCTGLPSGANLQLYPSDHHRRLGHLHPDHRDFCVNSSSNLLDSDRRDRFAQRT